MLAKLYCTFLRIFFQANTLNGLIIFSRLKSYLISLPTECKWSLGHDILLTHKKQMKIHKTALFRAIFMLKHL